MTQEDRTQLIREIKELIKLDFESRTTSYGRILDDETLNKMRLVLKKMLDLSLI